jgi:hypothetical protein
MMGFLRKVLDLLYIRAEKKSEYRQAEVYRDMRSMALSMTRAKLEIGEEVSSGVYSLIMETGYEEGVASLVAMGDGSASIYFSNGGGIIGIGESANAKITCLDLIADSSNYIKYANKTESTPLPRRGETIFYFLTQSGVLQYNEQEETLGNNRSPLSNLFYAAHQLITEARKAKEEGRNQ